MNLGVLRRYWIPEPVVGHFAFINVVLAHQLFSQFSTPCSLSFHWAAIIRQWLFPHLSGAFAWSAATANANVAAVAPKRRRAFGFILVPLVCGFSFASLMSGGSLRQLTARKPSLFMLKNKNLTRQ